MVEVARFKLVALLLSMIMLVPLTQASAAGEVYKYDFDQIRVVYAAEFTIYPESAPSEHWLTQIAGGPNKPIQILYGIIHLYNGDGYIDEQFIKMSGEGGSERFLSNSLRNDYYDENFTLKRQTSVQFWSGKKLDGNAVVKDFNEPLKSVTLIQSFDPQGQVTGFNLYAKPLIMPGTEWDPFSNYVSSYTYDPSSLLHAGESNGKEVEPKPEEQKVEEQQTEEPKAEATQP